jgi:hypothetical protein
MKKILFCLAIAAVLPVPHAFASPLDFSLGINIGSRPRPVVVAPATAPPVYHEPRAVINEPPLFIEPPELGFHVSVGTPEDIFYTGNRYYVRRQNVWYAAPHYRGPWTVTCYNALPWKLRRQPYERIRYYRDAGYRQYSQRHDQYWERHNFRPAREWREPRRGETQAWKRTQHEELDRSQYVSYRGNGR